MTQQKSREEGLTITQAPELGTPVKHGAGWWVPSGQVGYHVECVDGRWRCTCPSFRWRHTRECKHIAAVRKEVSMG
jgi:hypothetical protein